MTPDQLIKLGAGLQRLADRVERGQVWRYSGPDMYVDAEGRQWEYTPHGWQGVIS
jgi:hypothetical protein